MYPPVPHTRTEITEEDEAAVLRALRGRVLVEAGLSSDLESWFTMHFGGEAAVATGSGSQALVVSLRALGVGPGDEVILPTYVCAQVLAAVEHVGAQGVSADIADDWMLDVEAVSNLVTPRTKAIITAQMFGLFRDMAPLKALGLPVIEDCAQTFPDWKNAAQPLSGDIVVFSFEATKPVAGGEGGMVLVRDPSLAGAVTAQKQFRDTGYRANFHPLPNMAAALVASQLDRYPDTLSKRAAIASRYIAALDEISPDLVATPVRQADAWHRFLVRTEKDPAGMIEQFSAYGIAVRQPVEVPLHLLCPDTARGEYPVAEDLWQKTLSLPIYPELGEAEQGRVIDACRKLLA
jgi:UDP-4-amino-4-deoxy-L-arabinose-oxoglutarate aminotransferase